MSRFGRKNGRYSIFIFRCKRSIHLHVRKCVIKEPHTKRNKGSFCLRFVFVFKTIKRKRNSLCKQTRKALCTKTIDSCGIRFEANCANHRAPCYTFCELTDDFVVLRSLLIGNMFLKSLFIRKWKLLKRLFYSQCRQHFAFRIVQKQYDYRIAWDIKILV